MKIDTPEPVDYARRKDPMGTRFIQPLCFPDKDHPMNKENPELRLAEDIVRHTNRSVFLTGKAGTGKTTFLHDIQRKTHKRLVVTAPTGVAAINAAGVTLHSFFQLPFGPFIPGGQAQTGKYRMRKEKKNIIKSLDLLIIDEISMVRADMLDGVDSVLQRYRRSGKPFGGVQLLMIGDLLQLPPVVQRAEWRILQNHYDSPYFFSSTALARTDIVAVELRHIYRQSDQHFIDLLNRIRDKDLDSGTLQLLNSRHIPDFKAPGRDGYISLYTHNRQADAANQAKLDGLPGKRRLFHAEINGEFPEHLYPTAAELEMKTGAQVMFIRNDLSGHKAYFNGKIGTVTDMSDDAIEVRCPEDRRSIHVDPTIWENIEYTIDPQTAEISQKVIGTFSQYPLKPAWAITVHKSQGLTFDRAIIDVQAAFAHGQVYVALSRCRSLEGLVLSKPVSAAAVKTDPTVQRFVDQLKTSPPSAEDITRAKSDYQQQLLMECFTFDRLHWLLGRLNTLLQRHAGVIQVSGAGDIREIFKRTSAEIYSVGNKFKKQLQGMFTRDQAPTEDPAITDRLIKASAYFNDTFKAFLVPYLDTLAVETDNKEIRKQIRQTLKQLNQENAVKLAAVFSCKEGFSPEGYLKSIAVAAMEDTPARAKAPSKTGVVMFTEADVGHPELFERLRQWRAQKASAHNLAHFQVLHQKTLIQIAVHLPDTIVDLKKIKGIGDRLAERYGEELITMVADYRHEHDIRDVSLPDSTAVPVPKTPKTKPAVKEDTKQVSLDLYNQGLTIPQIAEQRGLTATTVEGHMAHWIASGEIDIDRFITEEKRFRMEHKIVDLREKPLKELKLAVDDDCSYGDIKLVLAHLRYQASQLLEAPQRSSKIEIRANRQTTKPG
jgi:hypothetical protein